MPNKITAEFLIITEGNAECSFWVKQCNAERTETYGSWFPEECCLPTSHVYVLVEVDDVNLHSQILAGDDWRFLEKNGLRQAFFDQIMSGIEPQLAISTLMANASS